MYDLYPKLHEAKSHLVPVFVAPTDWIEPAVCKCAYKFKCYIYLVNCGWPSQYLDNSWWKLDLISCDITTIDNFNMAGTKIGNLIKIL